jgi:hypothetical protein
VFRAISHALLILELCTSLAAHTWKGTKLLDAVKAKYGASIKRWACEMYTATSPLCIRGASGPLIRQDINPSSRLVLAVVGNLTLLIYNQCQMGRSNGSWNTDHEIKLDKLFSLCSKECRGVAWRLYELCCFIAPPSILQMENGGDFNGIALDVFDTIDNMLNRGDKHSSKAYCFIRLDRARTP